MSASEGIKWETYSEETDDEDLVMEEHDEVEEGEIDDDEDDDEELEEQRRSPSSFGQPRGDSSGKNAVYSEEFASFSSSREHHMSSPRFNTGRGHHDFSRFDMGSSGSSPLHGWSDAIDEKGESIALQIHLEKSIVHQKFFNNFDDDFDEDDLA